MQQLHFHAAWDKTISPKDRVLIEELFDNTYDEAEDPLMSPILRTAINHKHELLVTVLIHNFTHRAVQFKNRDAQFSAGDDFYEQSFTIPDLIIPAFTSMPWTFIFTDVDMQSLENSAEMSLEIL